MWFLWLFTLLFIGSEEHWCVWECWRLQWSEVEELSNTLLADHCNRSTHYKLVFKDIRFCYRSYNSVVMFLIFPRVVSSCTLFWIERSRNFLKVDVWRVSDLSKPACSLCITSLTMHWFPIRLSNSVGCRLKVTICWTVPFFLLLGDLIHVCRWIHGSYKCLHCVKRALWVRSPDFIETPFVHVVTQRIFRRGADQKFLSSKCWLHPPRSGWWRWSVGLLDTLPK